MISYQIIPSVAEHLEGSVKRATLFQLATIFRRSPLIYNGNIQYTIAWNNGLYEVSAEEPSLLRVREEVPSGQDPTYVGAKELVAFESRWIEVFPFQTKQRAIGLSATIEAVNSGLPYCLLYTVGKVPYLIDKTNLFFFWLSFVSYDNLKVFRNFSSVNYQAWQALLWYSAQEVLDNLTDSIELPCGARHSPEEYVRYALDPF